MHGQGKLQDLESREREKEREREEGVVGITRKEGRRVWRRLGLQRLKVQGQQ